MDLIDRLISGKSNENVSRHEKDIRQKYKELREVVALMQRTSATLENSENWALFLEKRQQIKEIIHEGAILAKEDQRPKVISIFTSFFLQECIRPANQIVGASHYLVDDCLQAYFEVFWVQV